MAVISKMRAATTRIDQQGFTLMQMIIIVALVSVVTTFGAIGIVKARAHMRLARSARQFSTMAEKARADSVRRHAMDAAMANLQLLSTTRYSVTMDFDGNGVIDAYDTRTFDLEEGVTFAPGFVGTTITFDWRGRSVTGQVSPTMILFAATENPSTTLITVSGAGDITLDIESFPDGSIPDVALNGTPTGDIRQDPPPNPSGTPGPGSTSPTPTPTPNPDPNATPMPTPLPTPTPCTNNGVNCLDTSPTPTPTPQPTLSPTPTPTPIPTTGPCTLTASPSSLTLANRETASLALYVQNSSGTTTVSLSANSNTSHISVTPSPGQTGIVTGGAGTVTFNVVMNGANQVGTISFTASSPCSASTSVGVNQ
jgi:type II secretory pathway pseudopilin PulG